MASAGVYLKHNTVAEPLFNQWHAWSYLIPPAPAAMFIANSHLKMMRSFVSAPEVHVAALKNPAMLGGSFINHPASKAPAIKELMNRTMDDCASMLELAEAIKPPSSIPGFNPTNITVSRSQCVWLAPACI